ncbi:hypothetical protein M422DRAFT_254917 [Sphaerobolus stellatus SS14]|uniref:Uncharacterized protein n=1 Tax=Sphaerobolus stellatus (strain SS14) TaxID=990650 RepID=A0A0C9V514_SPHS4|nr:hypothetical protein M422DRAFT_254917 [Sphaerobolus stellatus SS14]
MSSNELNVFEYADSARVFQSSSIDFPELSSDMHIPNFGPVGHIFQPLLSNAPLQESTSLPHPARTVNSDNVDPTLIRSSVQEDSAIPSIEVIHTVGNNLSPCFTTGSLTSKHAQTNTSGLYLYRLGKAEKTLDFVLAYIKSTPGTTSINSSGQHQLQQRRHNIELQDDMEFDNPSSDEESDSSMSSLSSLSSLSSASSIANISSHIELGDGMDWAGDGMVFDEDEEEEEERHSQRMQAIHRHLNFIMINRVLEPNTVHKQSQLHLILVLYKDGDPKRFRCNLRVSPSTFDGLLAHIIEHPVFFSQGPKPQMPTQFQLAISLFRFSHFGNAASVESVTQWAGVSTGQVVKCTRCHHSICIFA